MAGITKWLTASVWSENLILSAEDAQKVKVQKKSVKELMLHGLGKGVYFLWKLLGSMAFEERVRFVAFV